MAFRKKLNEDSGEFVYISDETPISNYKTLTDNNLNIANASSKDRIVYTLKDSKVMIESRHYLDFRRIHTVCETWKNTNAENIVSSFKDICSRNNQKWQPLIRQAIKTIEDIQPTNINLGKTTVKRALLEIKICMEILHHST